MRLHHLGWLRAVTAATLLLGALGTAATASAAATAAKECAQDRDCMSIPDGCCDCSSGGAMRAVPKARAAREQRAQKARCKDQACLAVLSDHPSCTAPPQCREGRCVLAMPGPPQAPAPSPAPTSGSAAPAADAPLVVTARGLESHVGQVIRIRGRYVQIDVRTPPQQPPVYRGHAGITLPDGSVVTLYASDQPEAIRPADELARFTNQEVSVLGKLRLAPAVPGSNNSPVRPCLIDVAGITAEPKAAPAK